MKKNTSFHKKTEKTEENALPGLLIAHFGATAEIETPEGHVLRCHIRKNAEPYITGDRIWYTLEKTGTGILVGHAPRTSLLARPDAHNKIKLVAANVNKMLIVTAPPPILAEHLLDRYLITAENLNLQPLIIFNKTDLLTEEMEADVLSRLNIYAKIGYPVLFTSVYTKQGLPELQVCLKESTSILVGPSGVGKSSLITCLIPDKTIQVGEISTHGLGKHTTTLTRLYHLPEGGSLIDSPGVREFGLGQITKEAILQGFIEFKPFLSNCKFRNCLHFNEIDCGVQKAVATNQIAPSRFESYKAILKPQYDVSKR